jgi:uncharacterized membrane protein HdeD (DUF308 family)
MLDLMLSRRQATLRGLLAVILGLLAIVWPGLTIGIAVALFCVYCFVDAIFELSALFEDGKGAGERLLMVAIAVIDIAAGIVAIAYPNITAGALVVVIAIWAIVGGIAEIVAGASGNGESAGWLVAGGVLSILAGIVLFAWPGIGAVTIALIFGFYLLGYGISLLIAAASTPAGETLGGLPE